MNFALDKTHYIFVFLLTFLDNFFSSPFKIFQIEKFLGKEICCVDIFDFFVGGEDHSIEMFMRLQMNLSFIASGKAAIGFGNRPAMRVQSAGERPQGIPGDVIRILREAHLAVGGSPSLHKMSVVNL
jgi:hypothetical protein